MQPAKRNELIQSGDMAGTCSVCASLIRLCSGLDFFPQDPEVWKILVDQLHRLAKDHTHARAMVDRWTETQAIAPKVANLVALAAEVGNSPALPAGCDKCNAEPFVVHDHGATRCACLRGQALRQMDQRREERPQGNFRQPRPVVYRSPLPDTQ